MVQDVFVKHKADLTAASVVTSGVEALSFIYAPGHLGDLCGYQDPTLAGLIDQISAVPPTDPQAVQLWRQAQDFVVSNALSVWGVWLPTVIAYNGNRLGGVQTIFLSVTAYPDFLTAYVKK